MKSALTLVITLSLAVTSALAQGSDGLTINTPTLQACVVGQVLFSGGLPPYTVSVLIPPAPSSNAIIVFPTTSANSLSWLVTAQQGTQVYFHIADSKGETDDSAPITIGAGNNNSCTTQGTTSFTFGATSVSSGTTPTDQSSSATGTTSVTISGPASSTASGSVSRTASGSASGTTSSTSPTRSSGASRVAGPVAAAGILGVAMVALLG